jgi:Holliday junction resolvase
MSGFKKYYNLRESKIEGKVVKYAQEKGWLVRKYASPGQRGVPDRIFMGAGGRIIFIEFKAPNGVLSKLQEKEIEEMRARGQRVFVIDNIGEGYDLIDKEGE